MSLNKLKYAIFETTTSTAADAALGFDPHGFPVYYIKTGDSTNVVTQSEPTYV